VIATLGVIGALAIIGWSPWSGLRFRGDGTFSDGGFFSYPRYVLTFPDMPLYESGERRFHFRGLPNEKMTLLLYVKGSSGNNEERSRLTKLPTSIEPRSRSRRSRAVRGGVRLFNLGPFP